MLCAALLLPKNHHASAANPTHSEHIAPPPLEHSKTLVPGVVANSPHPVRGTGSTFPNSLDLAASDLCDLIARVDHKVDPVRQEVHGDGLSRSDHAHFPQKQNPFQRCRVLADKHCIFRCIAGVLCRRRHRGGLWRLRLRAGRKQEKAEQAFHHSLLSRVFAPDCNPTLSPWLNLPRLYLIVGATKREDARCGHARLWHLRRANRSR